MYCYTDRQLILTKGKEKYIFRYRAGEENQLLDAIIEAAKDKRTNFDWFDAAVLSFKLTQSLILQADQLLKEYKVGPTNQSFNPGDFYQKP